MCLSHIRLQAGVSGAVNQWGKKMRFGIFCVHCCFYYCCCCFVIIFIVAVVVSFVSCVIMGIVATFLFIVIIISIDLCGSVRSLLSLASVSYCHWCSCYKALFVPLEVHYAKCIEIRAHCVAGWCSLCHDRMW